MRAFTHHVLGVIDESIAMPAFSVEEFLLSGGSLGLVPEFTQSWLRVLERTAVPEPGKQAGPPIFIPVEHASILLRVAARGVAGVGRRTASKIVWTKAPDELMVDLGTIDVECLPGLLNVGLDVFCDELGRDGPVRVVVPFGVGRAEQPRGLVMSTLDRVVAPSVVAQRWSDPITALCWESLLEVATRVTASVGHDQSELPLIAGALGAEQRTLVVHCMARHPLQWLATEDD